jgi:hypothetical protein
MSAVIEVTFIEDDNRYFMKGGNRLTAKGTLKIVHSDGHISTLYLKTIEDQWGLQVEHGLRTQEAVDQERRSIVYTEDLLKPLDDLLKKCCCGEEDCK